MQRSRDLPGAGPSTLARVCAGLVLVFAMGGLVPAVIAQESTPPPPPPAPKTGSLTRTAPSRAREAVQNLNQASANAQRQANPADPAAAKPAPAGVAAAKPGVTPPATGAAGSPRPVTTGPATTPSTTKAAPSVQLATSSNKAVTGVAPGTQRTVNVPKMAPQEERVTYQYNALGRRDPFQPLIGGGFVGIDVGGAAPPDVGGLKVVGIVWGAQDKFALAEDPRGNSMVLRKGDKVMNGVVEELRRDGVVVKLTTDGQTQSVVIPLTQKGEQSQ